MKKPMKKEPVYKTNSGRINAAVFENKTKEGKTFYSVSISRSYSVKDTDGNQEWRNTSSFSEQDLTSLPGLVTKVQLFLNSQAKA